MFIHINLRSTLSSLVTNVTSSISSDHTVKILHESHHDVFYNNNVIFILYNLRNI